MNRITKVFEDKKKAGKKALVSYIMGGDPDVETSLKIITALAENGSDVIELGFPFSDPVAEGPTIQKAAERALKNGVCLKDIFGIAKKFREKSSTPLVLMGYYNPVLVYGEENFIKAAKKAGVDGFIIVDLPPEEDDSLAKLCKEHGLCLIKLTTPTTDETRAQKILRNADGFVYYVSVAGVTGQKEAVSAQVREKISALRKSTNLPICVGFGIKNPEAAKEMSQHADGVVVGSAYIKIIEENLNNKEQAIANCAKLSADIAKAIG